MKYDNYEQFKQHAQALKKSLISKIQDPQAQKVIKLSLVQEALAQSLNYANLAAFKAQAFAGQDQLLNMVPDNLGSFLLCVEGLAYNQETMEDVSFAIINSDYATTEDIRRTAYREHRQYRSEGYDVDAHLPASTWEDCVVTAVHIECPSISKYGVPYYGDEESAPVRIAKNFSMKVLKNLDISIHDRGDDGGTTVFFEVRAPQSVFNAITALPLVNTELEEI